MDHKDHVHLLRDGISSPGGVWAELGSGRGAFTLALAELLGSEGTIFSIDKDRSVLDEQARAIQKHLPQDQPTIHYLPQDYRASLDLPRLNGVLMANTLHFHDQKTAILESIREYLLPGGNLIVVEYNSDRGNTWVPYPISFHNWQSLAEAADFTRTRLLSLVPSSFMGEIYSAISYRRDDPE
jgi:ubiquinone/menaquinone biosynthesis C-methylase UbiE